MRQVIGIAGTAKNTGKTTTMQAVAAYLRSQGCLLFLTSIGFDGEDLDNVTGLPKPKVTVEPGDRIATALPLFSNASARFFDFEDTGVRCALGPVYSATAASAGRLVIAGPASTQEVESILNAAPSNRTVLLDGALSRLAPMSLATAMIVATGAARSEDPRILARELNGISSVMSLPKWEGRGATAVHIPGGLYAAGSELALPGLLASQVVARRVSSGSPQGAEALNIHPGTGDEEVRRLLEARPSSEVRPPSEARLRVEIDGPVNPEIMRRVISSIKDTSVKAGFILNHPVDLLLSGDYTLWPCVLEEATASGHVIAVRRPASLLGFTVNPYVPRFDSARRSYTPHVLPAKPFIEAIRSEISAPCTDIVAEGPGVLESWLHQLPTTSPHRI